MYLYQSGVCDNAANPLSTYSTVKGKKQSSKGIENKIVKYSSFQEDSACLIAWISHSTSPEICLFNNSVSAFILVNFCSALAFLLATTPLTTSPATPSKGLIKKFSRYILLVDNK